jgi:glycine betaine/proline transport system substrate-binding protein
LIRLRGSCWLAGLLALAPVPGLTVEIVIGVPNWPSVSVTAHIIEVILETRYGAQVELQTAANPVIFEAMAKGSMHIHPEVWLPNQQPLYDRYAASLVRNEHPARGVQGICANGAARDAGIRDVSDLTDPAKALLLDSDADGRGEIFIGAPGWSSTLVERLRAREYGYALMLTTVEMDEGLSDSQLAIAEQRGRPWVGFCYAPHHRFIIHPDLKLLSEPPYQERLWHVPARVGMGWPPQLIQPMFSKTLAARLPAAATLLQNMDLTSEDMSQFAFEIVVNKKDPAEYARSWVGTNAVRIARWLKPAAAAQRND